MTVADTKRTIDRCFDLMGPGIDFDACYAADVTWLVADTGEAIEGAHSVRDYVVALHGSLTAMRTRQLVVGDDSVYLERDCAAQSPGAVGRTHYCMAYDVRDDLIAAIRCYGVGGSVEGQADTRPSSPQPNIALNTTRCVARVYCLAEPAAPSGHTANDPLSDHSS